MPKLNVNPTRQELLLLKKKLKTAQRGYKLLKEKRDGLMKQFLSIIREAKEMRINIEDALSAGFKSFTYAAADMRPEFLEEALLVPTVKTELKAKTKNVMSVNIPQFKFAMEGDYLSYGLMSTATELDNSLSKFSDALKEMVRLAEIEHSAKLLAEEIEKTRRRVNALEYVTIPNIQETVKYIQAKLNEQERSEKVVMMKVKDLIQK